MSPMAPRKPDPADLAALIGSRICHDLVNPLGAIGNGLELLTMAGAAGPEIGLIADSVAQANARIRLFRVAFGAAGPDHRIARAEVLAILADLTRGTRLAVEWSSPADLGRAGVKLAFLALMACETALPYGGTVKVRAEGDGWTVTGSSPRLRLDPAHWAQLTGRAAAPPAPAQVHLMLLPMEAARAGRRLETEQDEGQVTFRF